ncbi:Hypothetical protein A7982_07626 [Minicystis rosea]|nr:Hypothetical protein A7982_07626 [Minicystis rosea]
MLRVTSLWSLDRPKDESAWPDRLRLHGDLVLGQWFALRRTDGSMVWERALRGVNYITGIHEETIVCAHVENGWTSGVGARALRLSTGELLWSMSIRPLQVRGREIVCMDGTVRDIASASIVRSVAPPPRFFAADMEESLSWALSLTHSRSPALELAPGIFVACQSPTGERRGSDAFCGFDRRGETLWWFSPEEQGWHCETTRVDRHVVPPYVYLVASPKRPYVHVDVDRIRMVPAKRYLLVFDVRAGRVVQQLPLGTWQGHVHIEDADAHGVLLCFVDRHLSYFASEPPFDGIEI